MSKTYIDISHHNTIVNYDTVAKSCDGAFVRLTYGLNGIDRKGIEYAENLHAAGLPVGCYFYSYVTSPEDADAEVSHFLGQVRLLTFTPDLPLVIDMEDADDFKGANFNQSDAVNICHTACKKIEEAGYYAMIYASDDWFTRWLNVESLEKYDRWVARWNNTPPKNWYGIWQYSSTNHVEGIANLVDTSVSGTDYAVVCRELYKRTGLYDGDTAIKPTDNKQISVGDIVYVTSRYDYNGIKNDAWVISNEQTFVVMQVNKDRVVVGRDGVVTGAWHFDDVKPV